MEANELFSANLVRVRKLRGLSQRELAAKSGISYRMICHYENSPVTIPINKLKTLADALDIDIADLFKIGADKIQVDTLDVRWIKKIQDMQMLSEADQKDITRHINSLLKKLELEKKLES